MADQPANAKKKAKSGGMNARTLALGVVFLGLIAIVAYLNFGRSDIEELVPEPDQVLDAEGKPVPPPQPLVEPDPGTMPPGNLEEVRPS